MSERPAMKSPERIYLVDPDIDEEEDAGPGMAPETEGVYWCEDRVHKSDVEYIRADLAAALSQPHASEQGAAPEGDAGLLITQAWLALTEKSPKILTARDFLAQAIEALTPDAALSVPQQGAAPYAWASKDMADSMSRERTELYCVPFSAAPHAPAPVQAAPTEHPDDAAVDRFAVALKAKLAKQRAKGYEGWEDCAAEYLQELLFKHIPKGDPVDVGNFAMFLWARGERTAYEDQWVYDLTGKWPAESPAPVAALQGAEDRSEVLRVAKEVGLIGWISDDSRYFEFTESEQPSQRLIEFAKRFAASGEQAASPTVEQAITALVSALADSKGWMRGYADAIVRDAIDRRGGEGEGDRG